MTCFVALVAVPPRLWRESRGYDSRSVAADSVGQILEARLLTGSPAAAGSIRCG